MVLTEPAFRAEVNKYEGRLATTRLPMVRLRARSAARAARIAWAPSLTRRLLRNRWLWIALTLVVAIAGFSAVREQNLRFDEHVAAWGEQAPVVRVAAPVRSGEAVASALEIVQRPVAMLPDAALRALPADGAVAKADLFPGEFLIADRLATGADIGGPDRRSMTVDIEGSATLVEVGDLVDLWAADPRSAFAVEVVTSVLVLERTDDALTVAIPHEQVGAVAAAALHPLTVARVG